MGRIARFRQRVGARRSAEFFAAVAAALWIPIVFAPTAPLLPILGAGALAFVLAWPLRKPLMKWAEPRLETVITVLIVAEIALTVIHFKGVLLSPLVPPLAMSLVGFCLGCYFWYFSDVEVKDSEVFTKGD